MYLMWRIARVPLILTTWGEVLPCPPFCQSSGLLRHSSLPVPASSAISVMLAA